MTEHPRAALELARSGAELWLNGRTGRFPSSLADAVRSSVGPASVCTTRLLRISNEVPESAASDQDIRRRLHAALRDALNRHPLPSGMHAILHGSYATGTVTPFSDVDVTLILDENVKCAAAALVTASSRDLMRIMYRAAPLAHHGVGVIFRAELERYDQSLLPLAALEHGIILGVDPLEFEVSWDQNLSQLAARARFERQIAASRRNFSAQSRLLYRRQSALSVLLLLPSLFLEAVAGVFPYKRDSFELAKPYFRPEEWLAIEQASDIRRCWRLPSRLTRIAAGLNSPASPLRPEISRKIVAALSIDGDTAGLDALTAPALKFIDRCEELLHACR